jgi:hypothetical protein
VVNTIIVHKPDADVREVWITAADIIETNGLAIDAMVDYVAASETLMSLRQAPVCTIGAIRIAYGHDPDDPDANGARCPALAALADWLIRTQQATCTGVKPGAELDPGDVISTLAIWSDRLADAGGADAVIAGLRAAAREWEVMPSTS